MPITGTPNCIEGRDNVVYTFDGADFCFDDNPYCWDDVQFVVHLGRIARKKGWQKTVQQLEPEEKEKLITLICQVEGYEQTEENKKIVSKKVTAKRVELLVVEVLKKVGMKTMWYYV